MDEKKSVLDIWKGLDFKWSDIMGPVLLDGDGFSVGSSVGSVVSSAGSSAGSVSRSRLVPVVLGALFSFILFKVVKK